jgi:hypothetical protein
MFIMTRFLSRHLLFALVLAFLLGPLLGSRTFAAMTPTVSSSTTAHPVGCQPGEIFVDSQDWWGNPDGGPGDDFGHLHLQLCWPHLGTINKITDLPVRVVMHDNPGAYYHLTADVFNAGGTSGCPSNHAIFCFNPQPRRTLANCEATGGILRDNGNTCVWQDKLTIDPAKIRYSGWQEFRFRAFVRQPNKDRMYQSTGLFAYVENGKERRDISSNVNYTEARGWYENVGYVNARLINPPLGPVKGLWQPEVRMYRGSGGITVTSHYAALNTDFHNGNRGIVIKEGSGEFRGRLSIDTTKLANGWHRLFLSAEAFDPITGSTNSGVLATWFQVQN